MNKKMYIGINMINYNRLLSIKDAFGLNSMDEVVDLLYTDFYNNNKE